MQKIFFLFFTIFILSCNTVQTVQEATTPTSNITEAPFLWENANFYFLLTDRFNNGDEGNDIVLNRTEESAVLRGFKGGDLRGIITKIEDGYFSDLGVNAIWLTPIVEQIHGATNEGSGKTYAYHGYWTKDWTTLDPNFGTEEDLKELVEKAHERGIKIVLDAVVNHTGPVTNIDNAYPDSWVRHEPECTYKSYSTTIDCVLVKNLPDILTERNTKVELPEMLTDKWKSEGRYDDEIASLNTFFETTGYPRAPKYYIMKWLADYIKKFGIDGYRVDTVKHTTEDVWADFAIITQNAFDEYNKSQNLEQKEFFLVGEVYGYGINQNQFYNFPDKKVNYFENGFEALINFDFKYDAKKSYEELFSYYSNKLNNELNGFTVMNYLSSHDDGSPFDKKRKKTYESGTKLLLSPGISQIYYGDESARSLIIKGTIGDATLRSKMNWNELNNDPSKQQLLQHYQKLGQFRINHPSVGAGVHKMISSVPYWFKRTYNNRDFIDEVIIGLDLQKGKNTVDVSSVWKNGTTVRDAYSGALAEVKNGSVTLNSAYNIVLLEKY